MYGYSPQSFPLTFDKTEFPHLDERLQSLKRARHEALAAREIAQWQMAGKINRTFAHFKIGQKVWLDACQLIMRRSPQSKKDPSLLKKN